MVGVANKKASEFRNLARLQKGKNKKPHSSSMDR
jgi:hypothetical protein